MIDEASFVEEIRRSPHDIVPRLIYADFLEDRGDPRGELIRVQCELSSMEPGTPGRADLFNRERVLLDTHGQEWLAPLKEMGVQGLSVQSFRGGLLEHVRMDVSDFLRNGRRLCEIAPALCRLQLRNLANADSLEELTIPDQITGLNLSANRLTVEWWRQFSDFLQSGTVTDVNLQTNRLGEGDSLISLSHAWPNLESLCVGDNHFRRLSLVIDIHLLDGLRHLDVHRNRLDDTGLEHFLSGEGCEAIEHLNLSACNLSSIEQLADPDRFPSLKELIVRNNRLSTEDWNSLPAASRDWLLNLRVLDTRNNNDQLPARGL